MKDNKQQNGCPDIEDLSAFYDGEIPSDSQIAQHIQECRHCHEVIAAFKILDDKLKTQLTTQIPPGLTDRIKAGVHNKLEQQKQQRKTENRAVHFPGMFFKVAAAIIVCFGLSFYFISRLVDQPDNSGINGTAFSKNNIDVVDVKNHKPDVSPPANTGAINKYNIGGAIPIKDLEAVTFTPGRKISPIKGNIAKNDQLVPIPNRVQHVWVVRDLNKVKRELMAFAQANHIPKNKMIINPGHNKIKCNFRLTKRQLVELVNICAHSGLDLISPYAPQPEQKRFACNAQSPVQYNVDFVLAEK